MKRILLYGGLPLAAFAAVALVALHADHRATLRDQSGAEVSAMGVRISPSPIAR
jgi:hypothetical protein